MPELAAQTQLQCDHCGGQCVYSPAAQMLSCTSCGQTTAVAFDRDADPTAEYHYDPDLPHTEQSVVSQDRTHACQTCGGEVVFTGAILSERCAYCDGPVVLKAHAASYETMGVIPFRITQDAAQRRALDWGAARLAAPDDLSTILAQGRVAGIYVPFWTFDSHEAVSYFATYRVRRGKRSHNRTVKGDLRISFDDLLMPASPHVTPLIRDGILHDFNPQDLRPYTPAYLAGFAAERHHQSVKEGLAANAPDKDLLIRNRIRNHVNKNGVRNISYKTNTTGMRYRRILLPVWILHYSYAGTPKKIVVCGLHGRTFGERPFSTKKLAGYAAAIAAITIAVGWLWGATQLL
jgi:hypothetical protein